VQVSVVFTPNLVLLGLIIFEISLAIWLYQLSLSPWSRIYVYTLWGQPYVCKIKYMNKFVIRQPIFMNDGLFCSRKSKLYTQLVKLETSLGFFTN